MLKLKKNATLRLFLIYCKYTGFFNRFKIISQIQHSSFYNILLVKRRKRRLVCVRSPKHFNIGKSQFFFLRTNVTLYKKFYNYAINSYVFPTITYSDLIPVLPKTTLLNIQHCKLLIRCQVKF